MIPKTEIIPAEYYQGYLDMIQETDIALALENNTKQFRKFLKKIPKKKIDYAYAPGKWTIREVLQHIIDTERVFAYRALHYSRFDANPLPGFNENSWAANAGAQGRHWDYLIDEFKSLRKSTEYLFQSFSEDQLKFRGQANNRPMNAFTLGFLIPGHVAHHIKITEERYL